VLPLALILTLLFLKKKGVSKILLARRSGSDPAQRKLAFEIAETVTGSLSEGLGWARVQSGIKRSLRYQYYQTLINLLTVLMVDGN
jgi:hypothetical protein